MGWDCLAYKSHWFRDHFWLTVLLVEPLAQCVYLSVCPSVLCDVLCCDETVRLKLKQEAQLLLGMSDRTGPVVKLSYLRELVWQPSWELDKTVLIG